MKVKGRENELFLFKKKHKKIRDFFKEKENKFWKKEIFE